MKTDGIKTMSFISKYKYLFARLLNRRPVAVKNSIVHPKAKLGDGAQFVNSKIGKYSYLYDSSATETEIGAFCSIARGCVIGGGSHPTNWVSTSPVFYKGRNVLKTNFSQNNYEEYKKTVIGNDVWIGSGCFIKSGVTIGDGAVIGMGSVVTHDVPPYEIWAGNPARFIKKRFDDETIRELLELGWWNMSQQELESAGDLFNDPRLTINHFKEIKK